MPTQRVNGSDFRELRVTVRREAIRHQPTKFTQMSVVFSPSSLSLLSLSVSVSVVIYESEAPVVML